MHPLDRLHGLRYRRDHQLAQRPHELVIVQVRCLAIRPRRPTFGVALGRPSSIQAGESMADRAAAIPAAIGADGGLESGIRVRAGIDTPDPEVESAEVELPPLAVVIALLLVGQIVVAQHDARPAVLRVQRDDDTCGAGRDGVVVRPAPGENEAVRRVHLDELASRLASGRGSLRQVPAPASRRCPSTGFPFWEGSTWEWELATAARAETGTGVLFRHYGFADGYAEIDLAHTAQTWALILQRLAGYIASGSPRPFFPAAG
jgi:hypothetical protein